MASSYGFEIYLKDLATNTLGKISNSLSGVMKLTEKVNASTNKLSQSKTAYDKMSFSINELKNKLEQINSIRFSTTLKSEFEKTTTEARKLESQIKRLEQGISGNGLGAKLKGWRADFANSLPGADLLGNPLTMAGAAVKGFWDATQKAMDAGKEKMKLQTLTGSAEIGSALYEGLTKFATDTVFGNELYDMGVQMLSNGIKSADVMPIMKELGDISMGDANKLGQLSLAFAQIQGKGKLAGQELLQLVNAGFNPLQVLSEKTGESMGSLTKRMSDGEISVEDVRKAMQIATGEGGKFHNMLQNVANTPFGKLEGLKGQLDQMMVRIGNVFIPIASKMFDFFSWIGEKLGPFLEPVIAIIGALSFGLIGLAAAQWLVNIAMMANPIGLIIVGVLALIAGIVWLVTAVTGWGDAWRAIVNNCKVEWEHFTAQVNTLWETVANNFMIGLNKIKQGWYEFKSIMNLGDESENSNAIKKIAQDTENRKKAIEKAKGDEAKALQNLRKGHTGVLDKFKIKSFEMPTMPNIAGTGIKGNALGLINDNAKSAKKSASPKTKSKADSIVAGGSKQTNITINIDKVGTDTKIYVASTEQGVSNLGEKVREELLRAINSVNQLQTG